MPMCGSWANIRIGRASTFTRSIWLNEDRQDQNPDRIARTTGCVGVNM